MHAFGMLLLAAATAGDGFGYADADVGHKKWLRHHLVSTTPATAPPPYNAATLAGPGAAAANNGRRFVVTKSQVYFLDPMGMTIGWQNGAGPNGERTYVPAPLTVPARYNFNQGYIYRLKISNIVGRPTVSLYPTIEVAPTTPVTDAYLAHNAIPVQFTAEDFDQVVDGGNFVTKVIYLPDPRYQELAIAGVETLVSTRLEPGIDPILEADRRGTILLIVRLGAIDLESPVMAGVPGPIISSAPVSGVPIVNGGAVVSTPLSTAPADVAPGSLPPGVTAPTAVSTPNVILDPATSGATPVQVAPAPVRPAPATGTTPPAPPPVTATPPAPAVEPPAAKPPAQVPPPPPPGAPQ